MGPRDYMRFLQDNPKGYWFKRKLYGWGWTPATWQGWSLIFLYALLVTWSMASLFATPYPTVLQIIQALSCVVIGAFVLIAICYKTGEPPKWQWGPPKEPSQKD